MVATKELLSHDAKKKLSPFKGMFVHKKQTAFFRISLKNAIYLLEGF